MTLIVSSFVVLLFVVVMLLKEKNLIEKEKLYDTGHAVSSTH